MKKTKTIILAMSAALCLALSGCGGYTTVTADPSEVSEKKSDEQAKAASEEKAKDTAKAEEAAVSKKTAEEESTPSTAAEPAETEKKKKKKKSTRSSITNEKVSSKIEKQRPIAVMYPINYEAQPQYGLNKVDVFYEMIEEGDMSRQMGIIQDWHDLSLIGNIRSTRSYFVLEAMRYDAIMLHVGGPIDWLIDVTSREDLDNLNGVGGVLGGDYGAYYRIDNGKALEHTAFTDAESVKNACAAAGYSLEIRPKYYVDKQFYFNDPDDRQTLEQYENSIPVSTIDMSGAFPVTRSSLVYNEEDHKYYKYLYGEPQCDGITGEQMAFDNVIIQEAHFKYVGNHGYVNLNTISHGRTAYVLTNGRCVPCKWWRQGVHKHTSYYVKDGSRIHLNTGKTMVFIIRDDIDTFAFDGVTYTTQGDPLTPVYY